jgi:hypothetical protein
VCSCLLSGILESAPRISCSTLDAAEGPKEAPVSFGCAPFIRGALSSNSSTNWPKIRVPTSAVLTSSQRIWLILIDAQRISMASLSLKCWNAGSVRPLPSWFSLKAHHTKGYKRRANQRSVLEHACSWTTVSLTRLMGILIVCLLSSLQYLICRDDSSKRFIPTRSPVTSGHLSP